MLTGTSALFFESADAFLEFAQAFLGAGFAEAVGNFLQSRFQALAETLVNPLFFLLALFGMAVEADFLVAQVVNALDVNGAACGGFDRDGGLCFELPRPFATDH